MNDIYRTKIGFNYFQDAQHYSQNDAQTWIPRLKSMHASWLVLNAPTNATISQEFIQALQSAGIEPILHFKYSPKQLPDIEQFRALINNYAHWGIRHIVLFDRPNMRSQWTKLEWQANFVRRFAELFSLLAEPVLQAGITPILPPLQPGGDYWDTAFLDNVLAELKNHHSTELFNNMGVGAYAWFDEKPIDWGAGGQEAFPASKPYFTPSGSQDNKGFHIYDWYNTIIFSHAENGLPIYLLGVGEQKTKLSPQRHQESLQAILDTLNPQQTNVLTRMPENVLACNFWLLAAPENDPLAKQAWYTETGTILRSPELLETLYIQEPDLVNNTILEEDYEEEGFHIEDATSAVQNQSESTTSIAEEKTSPQLPNGFPPQEKRVENKVETGIGKPVYIENYVLLPAYQWGVSDWHLDVIKPYVKKYKPTIGFSVKEARAAKNVLVIGVASDFPNQNLSELYEAGCEVTQMRGDAEKIAEALAKA